MKAMTSLIHKQNNISKKYFFRFNINFVNFFLILIIAYIYRHKLNFLSFSFF